MHTSLLQGGYSGGERVARGTGQLGRISRRVLRTIRFSRFPHCRNVLRESLSQTVQATLRFSATPGVRSFKYVVVARELREETLETLMASWTYPATLESTSDRIPKDRKGVAGGPNF